MLFRTLDFKTEVRSSLRFTACPLLTRCCSCCLLLTSETGANIFSYIRGGHRGSLEMGAFPRAPEAVDGVRICIKVVVALRS